METLWVFIIVALSISLETSLAKDECLDQKMDIALVGDISKSMEKSHRNKLVDLVKSLVNKLGVSAEKKHYAIATFGGWASIKTYFNDKKYYNAKTLQETVNKEFKRVPSKAGTRTDLVLRAVSNRLFIPSGGDRPDAQNLMLIFTDGKPWIGKWDDRKMVPFGETTKALEKKNVNIVVVGVGKDLNNSKEDMKKIAGSKGKVLVYGSFDALISSVDDLLKAACVVNGGYSEWSEAECSVTCGGGVKTLKRTCINPPPSNRGKDCSELGPAEMTAPCNEQKCPVDGGYTEWSESKCSVTCGGGVKTMARTCTNPPPSSDGKDCSELGPAKKTVPCNEQKCFVDGGYTEWSESKCSVTCGGGVKIMTRTCTNPLPSNGRKDCSGLGPAKKTATCNEQKCPIDGGYTEWSESKCSVTCGGGVKTMTRTCTNPPPSSDGKDCSELGPAEKTVPCNEQKCPPPCSAGLDVGIVLDKSKSVKIPNLKKVIEFLGKLVKNFNPAPDGDHFGFVTFNKKAQMEFKFSDSQFHDKDALLKKIAQEPLTLQLKTRTDLALKMADEELFTEAGGDRPDKPNILIVLTDGKPTLPNVDFDFSAFAKEISKHFKAKEVSVVAVGIGLGVKEKTLREIAGEGNPVVQVEDFSMLDKMLNTIKGSACSG